MEKTEKMRHTLSHVLAAAVQELYPTTTFGIGPAIENGFYYDIDFGDVKISDTDLPNIEKKMRGIIAQGCKMVRRVRVRIPGRTFRNDIEMTEDGNKRTFGSPLDISGFITDIYRSKPVRFGPFQKVA